MAADPWRIRETILFSRVESIFSVEVWSARFPVVLAVDNVPLAGALQIRARSDQGQFFDLPFHALFVGDRNNKFICHFLVYLGSISLSCHFFNFLGMVFPPNIRRLFSKRIQIHILYPWICLSTQEEAGGLRKPFHPVADKKGTCAVTLLPQRSPSCCSSMLVNEAVSARCRLRRPLPP